MFCFLIDVKYIVKELKAHSPNRTTYGAQKGMRSKASQARRGTANRSIIKKRG